MKIDHVVKTIAALLLVFVIQGTAAADELTIVGTGSGSSVLRQIGKSFSAANSGITVSVPPSIGSGGGIKAVGRDENVLGRVARPIKDKEKHFGLTYVEYAQMPIVFYVNAEVSVSDLTPDQVNGIYSGSITNWKEVGGKEGKIRVIRREDGDSSLKVLRKSLAGFKDITLTNKSKTTFSDPETIAACEKTENAIAFGSWPDVKDNPKLKAISISGKKPTDGDYPHVGTLALIYKEKNKVGSVDTFVKYITSPDSHDAIRNAGVLPIVE